MGALILLNRVPLTLLAFLVLNPEQYHELIEVYEEAMIARVRAAQDEVAAGQFERMTAQELIGELAE